MASRGQIQLIIGPMTSGKTTELLRRVKRYELGQNLCIIVGHETDTNFCPAARLVQRLTDIDDDIPYYQVVGVDGGQFFPDLVEKCEEWANKGIIVIVAALDATFERKPFEKVINLIPKAEKILKLTAVCVTCGESAAFSFRFQSGTGGRKCIATCRACYFKL